jgi:formylglycine-generating enzyme required for sulfatase activity
MERVLVAVSLAVTCNAEAAPPSGYQCAPGKTKPGVGCDCPATHVAKRGDENIAICVPKPKPRNPGCPIEMVQIPKATFQMGVAEKYGDETPAHSVTLSSYCIDKTEVTVSAFTACVTAGKCSAPSEKYNSCNGTRSDRSSHPVNCVTWKQAAAYCQWASKRLPTEAEWEYAARGTDGRIYPWGNDPPTAQRLNACDPDCVELSKRVNIKSVPVYDVSDSWEATAPVGSFVAGASPFGVLDMAGNVSEWTADGFERYREGAVTNPRRPGADQHVTRGGSWYTEKPSVKQLRAVHRSSASDDTIDVGRGFRCAREE